MGLKQQIKSFYQGMEDKWYNALDQIDSKVPVYKIIDPIDSVFPSFTLFLILIFIILILTLFFSLGNINFEKEIEVSVLVSSKGLPIDGARVSVIAECMLGEEEPEIISQTSSSGKTKIKICEDEWYSLKITKDGFDDYLDTAFLDKKNQISAELSPKTTNSRLVYAKITDSEGEVLQTANLKMYCTSDERIEEQDGMNGEYEFDLFEDCEIIQLQATAQGYERTNYTLGENEERIELTLEKLEDNGNILFEIFNLEGGIDGAEVTLVDELGRTKTGFTDRDGIIEFEKMSPKTYNYTVIDSSTGISEQGTIELNPKENEEILIEFETITQQEVDNKKRIYVKVVDEENNPISYANTTIFKDGNVYTKTKRTDSHGKIELVVDETSSYQMSVKRTGYQIIYVDLQLKSSGEEAQKIVLKQGGGSISVEIFDEDETSVSRANILLYLNNWEGYVDSSTTDVNGKVLFENLPPGNYRIEAKKEDSDGEATTTISGDETASVSIRMVLGKGSTRFRIKNFEGAYINVSDYIVETKFSGQYLKSSEGSTERNYFTTEEMKHETNYRIKIEDGNYFPYESLEYTMYKNERVDTKEIYLMSEENLPNDKKVQMFLQEVYSTSPLGQGTANDVSTIEPGKRYYLLFNVILNPEFKEKNDLFTGFTVGPEDKNELVEHNPFVVRDAYSIAGSTTGIFEEQKDIGSYIDFRESISRTGKQAIVSIDDLEGAKQVPIVLVVDVDQNAVIESKTKIFFEALWGEESLAYEKEFEIGKKFCMGEKCPAFLFSNYLKWDSANQDYIVLTDEDRETLFVGDTYTLKTVVENLTDQQIGEAELEILQTSVVPKIMLDDSEKTKHGIYLRPLEELSAIETKIDAVERTSSLRIKEIIAKYAGTINQLEDYEGSEYDFRLKVSSKDQLKVDLSPELLYAGAEYPMFVINVTNDTLKEPIQANWKIEKEGVEIAAGQTDLNGVSVTQLSATNFEEGDELLVTAYATGLLDGTAILPVDERIHRVIPEPAECLSVEKEVLNLVVGGSGSFTIKSECEVDREIYINTEQYVNPKQADVLAGEELVINITGTVKDGLLGAYPVIIESINGSRNTRIDSLDVVVSDPDSDFELGQAIFDMKTTDTVSFNIKNKKFAGRLDNFHPKAWISTNSVSLSYNKPGNPAYIDLNATVMGSALESYFQSTLGTTILTLYSKEKCPNWIYDFLTVAFASFGNLTGGALALTMQLIKSQEPEEGDVIVIPRPASEASEIKCLDMHQSAAQSYYYDGTTVPKPEPDLNITNPQVALGRMPVPRDWEDAPPLESYSENIGIIQRNTQTGEYYNTEYPYAAVPDERGTSNEIAGAGYLAEINEEVGRDIFDVDVTDSKGTINLGCEDEDGTKISGKACLYEIFLLGKNAYYVGWPTYFFDNEESERRPSSGRVLPDETGRYATTGAIQGSYFTLDGQKYDYASAERWYEDAPPWMSMVEKGTGCYYVNDADTGRHETARIDDYKYLGSGRSYLQFRVHGNREWDYGICSENSAVLDLQFETTRGSEVIFERKAKWSEEVRINAIEGDVQDLGTYSATPQAELLGVEATEDGYGPWEGYPMEFVHYFTGDAHPNGFVNFERVFGMNETGNNGCVAGDTACEENISWYSFPEECSTGNEEACQYQKFVIRPPEDPLVEYDSSGNIMYYIPQDTVPGWVEGEPYVRMFLRDGHVYAEYIGKPEIESNNIEIELTKNNLLGEEYAIITVVDWVDGKKKEQSFQIKLEGAPSNCYDDEGTEGFTGREFAPKFLFDWEWSHISEDQCDYDNSGYSYCDASQFTIELFKKLKNIDEAYERNDIKTVGEESSFYSYLIKDNYSQEFLEDFDEYYSSDIANADIWFNSASSSKGFDSFITEHKISFENGDLPYGGVYQVSLDIEIIDPSIKRLFTPTGTNANIKIIFNEKQRAPNYNPFYETPFNGNLERNSSRNGYGTSITGTELRLNETTVARAYSGAMTSVEHSTSSTLNDLESGTYLIYDTTLDRIVFNPAQPTPVSMRVNGGGNIEAAYNVKRGSVSSSSIQTPDKKWSLLGSTIGGAVCQDFEGNPKSIFFDETVGSRKRIEWNGIKEGTIELASIFFTPSTESKAANSGDLFILTPSNQNTSLFSSRDVLMSGDSVFLNNYDTLGNDSYYTIKGVFEMIEDEKLCMSKTSSEQMKVWWNPEYLDEEIQKIETTTPSC